MSIDLFDDDGGAVLVRTEEKQVGLRITNRFTELFDPKRDLQHITRAAGTIRSLQQANVEDDAEFARLVSVATDFVGLSDAEVAYNFGLSRSVVAKWKKGEKTPHPSLRRYVYSWLCKRVLAMSELEEDQREAGASASRQYREQSQFFR